MRPPGHATPVELEGRPAPGRERERIVRFLDLVRQQAHSASRLRVSIDTNFPVAAGLASSASTFAALALAATRALELDLRPEELSALARRGSGSAARSIHGGYVEWRRGHDDDGLDSHAVQLAPAEHWPLAVVVAITDSGEKKVGSREGMAMVVKHSPFFGAWLDTHAADLEAIRCGIAARDLTRVGEAAEPNCLEMHAASMAARSMPSRRTSRTMRRRTAAKRRATSMSVGGGAPTNRRTPLMEKAG